MSDVHKFDVVRQKACSLALKHRLRHYVQGDDGFGGEYEPDDRAIAAITDALADYAALQRKLETAVEALKGVRMNVAYAHQPDNCGDHCRNSCRDCVLRNTLEDIEAAISAAEERVG